MTRIATGSVGRPVVFTVWVGMPDVMPFEIKQITNNYECLSVGGGCVDLSELRLFSHSDV